MPRAGNTALTINKDGSAVALIRGGMSWHASNYSDNTTWHAVGTNASGTHSPPAVVVQGCEVELGAQAGLGTVGAVLDKQAICCDSRPKNHKQLADCVCAYAL